LRIGTVDQWVIVQKLESAFQHHFQLSSLPSQKKHLHVDRPELVNWMGASQWNLKQYLKKHALHLKKN
jgi:hypothetical protein